ncbi:hypothetical protein CBF_0853 [Clostridium botulinum F str. 230613]|uniref:Uncharacterized protein n=1 Tax=Clostridium botulinum (strain Langeland / NCTC 10281 / Type F) TaxID=441772 RepID=A7GBJ4_CLOBL|nr:hypothetical protein CLI_0882 [Clostridium botulinum F str. Langeland]ADF98622.1 hypothetical protein CBF_0853 [Clostridium botulinum F str. 230613]
MKLENHGEILNKSLIQERTESDKESLLLQCANYNKLE